MVCSAAPVLLLAMTLPLMGSPLARESQPGQGQAGGESGQQLDQERGAGESVLVSVYVQLYFSSERRPVALSGPLTLPTASASSAPVTLTGLSLTAECDATHKGCSYCACLSGYQWNASICSHHRPCQTPVKRRPCGCLVFSPAEAGYCQLLPPVPAALSLDSWLQTPGDTLHLTLLTSQETTKLNWFLWPTGSPSPILLRAGSRESLTSSWNRAVLSIVNISRKWAGEYVCCFEARGFRWELHQMVRVPLQVTDVAGLPDQLSISCATSPGFQLSCCIPSAHLGYTASWSPRDGNEASLFNTPDSQCFVLAVQRCPAADTTYTCGLQGPGLSPLGVAVSVTVIQVLGAWGGDTTRPEDSSTIAWNVTKTGHVAQALCPGKRRGMVKRPCRPEGVWGPIHSSCTDTGLLALLLRARLLRAGQGWPVDEVPQILAQLPEQAVVVISPTNLLALVATMTILAKVVAHARIQLNGSALEKAFPRGDGHS
ncbi:adhesion G-protein coupled receptor F3 [Delphinapterus leucas]|uniref:Adhesion G-protein coupled receptor F3 n=1 Tax=Delphinapterus leucas TaxID=9749 RepID=A0A7F8K7M5_DELLE|nr:adhesion G-protein coupled receptor F3 [Delphinapterus leucas]